MVYKIITDTFKYRGRKMLLNIFSEFFQNNCMYIYVYIYNGTFVVE